MRTPKKNDKSNAKNKFKLHTSKRKIDLIKRDLVLWQRLSTFKVTHLSKTSFAFDCTRATCHDFKLFFNFAIFIGLTILIYNLHSNQPYLSTIMPSNHLSRK